MIPPGLLVDPMGMRRMKVQAMTHLDQAQLILRKMDKLNTDYKNELEASKICLKPLGNIEKVFTRKFGSNAWRLYIVSIQSVPS